MHLRAADALQNHRQDRALLIQAALKSWVLVGSFSITISFRSARETLRPSAEPPRDPRSPCLRVVKLSHQIRLVLLAREMHNQVAPAVLQSAVGQDRAPLAHNVHEGHTCTLCFRELHSTHVGYALSTHCGVIRTFCRQHSGSIMVLSGQYEVSSESYSCSHVRQYNRHHSEHVGAVKSNARRLISGTRFTETMRSRLI